MSFFGKLSVGIVVGTTICDFVKDNIMSKRNWRIRSNEEATAQETISNLEDRVKTLQQELDQKTVVSFSAESLARLLELSRISDFSQNVPHPGTTLAALLENEKISRDDLVQALDYSKSSLSRVINGSSKMTGNLAIRLEKAGLGSALSWMNYQAVYDLSDAYRCYNFDKCYEVGSTPSTDAPPSV